MTTIDLGPVDYGVEILETLAKVCYHKENNTIARDVETVLALDKTDEERLSLLEKGVFPSYGKTLLGWLNSL